jgi:hypothetical protein
MRPRPLPPRILGRRRSRLGFLVALALLAILGPHSVAQSPPPPSSPEPSSPGSASPAPSSPAGPAVPPSRSGAATEDSLGTFVPSEQVSADEAVAFPVDI